MMNNDVANKVWLIRQLNLPIELIDEISNYCFYDQEMTNTRNKFRDITEVFNSPLINGRGYNGQWWFWAEYGEKQFEAHNCTRCGNYIITNNYDTTDSVLCSCIYRENTDSEEDEDAPSIEDIENEEQEYNNFREGRREVIEHW